MNRTEIEQMAIQTIIAENPNLTYWGAGGVLRSIVTAFAAVCDELFYDITQVEKNSFIATAQGDALDNIAASMNITRLSQSYAGAVLVFSGDSGTIIPAGTQVRSDSGIIFQTLQPLVLGTANPGYDFFPSESLGDKVESQAMTPGALGVVSALTITTLVDAITGVDYVTNPSPSIGGLDAETDNQLRNRLKDRMNILNQGTLAFYESLIKELNSDILRVYACRGAGEREIAIYAASRSGSALTLVEKNYIRDSMTPYLPMLASVQVYDIDFTTVDVYAVIVIESGYTIASVFDEIAKNLAAEIDWSIFSFGDTVNQVDIFNTVKNSLGVKFVNETSFSPSINVECLANSLPKLGTITIVDSDNPASSVSYLPLTSYIFKY